MTTDNLKNKLSRSKDNLSETTKSILNKVPDRYYKLADKMGGQLINNSAGSYVLIKKIYSSDYIHGNFKLADIPLNDIPAAAFSNREEDVFLKQNNFMFFDTETTGLGGSDTVAFLIGCGSLCKNGFEIRQYLLPDYSDETAMLEALTDEFSHEKSIVSYNGASFDVPLINDRLTINRVSDAVEYEHHFDLLHSTRRIFKRRLQNCKLSNIENELLGFFRVDDTPGYLVPSIYFEWLSSENTDLMSSVLEHNRLDIISLYFLMNLISQSYQTKGDNLIDIDDLHSLSILFGRRKDYKSVEKLYVKIKEIDNQELSDDIILYHSLNFKKIGELKKAENLWLTLSDKISKESYRANLELAKYYEKCDNKKALQHTNKAFKICPYGQKHISNLEKRLSRLNKRLK